MTATRFHRRLHGAGGVASVACAVLTSIAAGQTATRYVDVNSAATSPNGLSWATAWPTLQQALDNAPTGAHVLVAQGTYLPTVHSGSTTDDRTKSFFVNRPLKIFGGFEAFTAFDSRAERGPRSRETILSGELGSTETERAYHVVIFEAVDDATQLDGFTITAGRADSPGVRNPVLGASGGGVFLNGDDGSSDPEEPVFVTAPVIQNCVIVDNYAEYDGGGLMCYGKSHTNGVASPTVRSCDIVGNIAFSGNSGGGGGIFTQAGFVELVNCVVVQNHAEGQGGAVHVGSNGEVSLLNCTIAENTTADNPFVSNECAGVFVDDVGEGTKTWIVNSILWGNDDTNTSSPRTFANQLWASSGTPLADIEVHYSDVEQIPSTANQNFSADPLFLAVDDYRLEPASPCRDEGDENPLSTTVRDDLPEDTYDVDDDGVTDSSGTAAELTPDRRRWPRVYPELATPIPDIGAHELRCAGDCNGDLQVDGEDLAIVLGEWCDPAVSDCCDGNGQNCIYVNWNSIADFNGDDIVNGADLAIVTGSWGYCLEQPAMTGGWAAMSSMGQSSLSPEELSVAYGFESTDGFAA